ncbi:YjgN family protein [Dongia sp.]|uniref:YjgN family protein n=1 Tax=Dongia sp. TaxID=1977262 RepID=UPI0035B3FB7C
MTDQTPDHGGQRAPAGFGRRPAEPVRSHFVYDGRLGELYGIFIVNFLLTIVTLSIFRFWGKTRVRRYLWAHTSLDGDRFEYTGTGGELFVGFIIVMIAYVIGSIGIQILGIFVEPESPVLIAIQMCAAFLILYLTFVAQYAAQRYRLTRTLWRGISGGMTGSAWSWGLKGMWFSLLSLLSLTLAWPWAQMRLIDDRLNNSYFGDAKASITTSSKPLYAPYLTGILCTLLGTATIIFGFLAIYSRVRYGNWDAFITGMGAPLPTEPPELQISFHWWPTLLWMFFVGYFGLILIGAVAMSWFYVAMARQIASKLELGGLRFATPLTPSALINRYVWNILIIVFTLGLGFPIAVHRTMQFLSRNIEVLGEIEGSEITRADLPRPKFGEGLLEAFDPGIL